MSNRFAVCLERVLRHEGGFVNHPDDPGGATNMGVTQRTYSAWLSAQGRPDQSVRGITGEEVAAIYREQYWSKAGAGLPVGLDYAVFDYAVNSGPAQAARDLQRVLRVEVDGIVGAQTRAAASPTGPAQIRALCARRMSLLKGLRHWRTFGRGWASRVGGVEEAAVSDAMGYAIAATSTEPAPTPKADPADKSAAATAKDALADAKAWTGPIGAVGAFLVSVSDMPEPVQWAIAGGFVMLAATGAVLLVRRATA